MKGGTPGGHAAGREGITIHAQGSFGSRVRRKLRIRDEGVGIHRQAFDCTTAVAYLLRALLRHCKGTAEA